MAEESSAAPAPPETTPVVARTSGSADFRKFVQDILQKQWTSASDILIDDLVRLHAFLSHVATMDVAAQSHHGPSKTTLITLFLRLFREQITGTKPTVFQALTERIAKVKEDRSRSDESNPPASAPPPAAPPSSSEQQATTGTDSAALSFWDQYSSPPTPPPPVFKSILADEATLAPAEFASSLFGELPVFLPPGKHSDALSHAKFAVMRPALQTYFHALTGYAFPAHFDDVLLRQRIFNYMHSKYLDACKRAGLPPRTIVRVVRQPPMAAPLRSVSVDGSNLRVNLRRVPVSSSSRVMFGLPQAPAPAPYPVPTATHLSSTQSAASAAASAHAQPAKDPMQRQIAALSKVVSSLAEHISTTSGTPVPGLDLTSSQDSTLPSFIKNSFQKRGYDVVVPDRIPQAEANVDQMWYAELQKLRSIKNSDGDRNPKTLREHMQQRFCPANLDVVNIAAKGPAAHRMRMNREEMLQLRDYEDYLQVRLARNDAENRSLGDAISKQEIDALKQREYELYGQIRTRYRLMLLSASDLRTVLTGLTDEEDMHFVQATFKGASSSQAQAMIKAMRKAGNATKRKNEIDATGGWRQLAKRRRNQGVRVCYQCGAKGNNYHVFTACPEWLQGKPPKKGTRFDQYLAQGKTIPKPKPRKKS